MVPSIEFVTSADGYNGFSAHPEGVHNRTLITFVIHQCRCTADAKTMHDKSITYEAKFDLICKALQVNVLDSWHNQRGVTGRPATIKPCKLLKINIKQDTGFAPTKNTVSYSMVYQLQSLLAKLYGLPDGQLILWIVCNNFHHGFGTLPRVQHP